MKLQIRGRSREQVGFVAACSVRKGGTGLELNYRGNNERTALSDGSNISYFVISTLFLGGPRREVNAGLGTRFAFFSACSGSPYRSRNLNRGRGTQNGTNETRNAYILRCLIFGVINRTNLAL